MPLHDPAPMAAAAGVANSAADMMETRAPQQQQGKRRLSMKSPNAPDKDGKRRKVFSAVQVQAERRRKSAGPAGVVQVPDSQGSTISSPRRPVLAVGLEVSRRSEGAGLDTDAIPRRGHLLSPDSSERSRSPNTEDALAGVEPVIEAHNGEQEAKAIIETWFWRGMFAREADRMINYTKEQLNVAELGEFADDYFINNEIDILMKAVWDTHDIPFIQQVKEWYESNPDPDPNTMERATSWFKRPLRFLPVEQQTPENFMRIHSGTEELVPSTPLLLNDKPPEVDADAPQGDSEDSTENRSESPSMQLEREITGAGDKNGPADNGDQLDYPYYIKYGIDSKSYTIIGRADQHHEFPDDLMPRLEESWYFLIRFGQEQGPLKYASEYEKLDDIPPHQRHERLVFIMEHMGICIASMKGIHYPYWAKNGRFKINSGIPVLIKEDQTWKAAWTLHRKLRAKWKDQLMLAKKKTPVKEKSKPPEKSKKAAVLEEEEVEDQITLAVPVRKPSAPAPLSVTVTGEGPSPHRSLLTPPSPVGRVTRQHAPRSEIPETPEPDVAPQANNREVSLTPSELVLAHRSVKRQRSPSPAEIYTYTGSPWVIVSDSEDSGESEDEDEDVEPPASAPPPQPQLTNSMAISSLISPSPSASVSSDPPTTTIIAPPRHIRKRPHRQFPILEDHTKSLPAPRPKLPTDPPVLNTYIERLNERESTLLGQLSQLEAKIHDLAVKHAKQRDRFQNPLYASKVETIDTPSSEDESMGDAGSSFTALVSRHSGSRTSSRLNTSNGESLYKVEERKELYLDYFELRKKQQMEIQSLEKRQEDVLTRLAEIAEDRDRARERFGYVNETLTIMAGDGQEGDDAAAKTISGKILEDLEIEEREEEEAENEKGLSGLMAKNMTDLEGVGVRMWRDLVGWGKDGLRMEREAQRMAERLRNQQQGQNGGAGGQANAARKKRRRKMNW